MKRICFLSGDIARSGGTERVTTVIAGALAEQGYDVSILSFSHGSSSFFAIDPRVRLMSLQMEDHSANLSDHRIWLRLHRFFREQAIDIAVCVDTILAWYAIPAALKTGTEVIAWEHFHLFSNVGDIYQRVKRTLGRRLAVCHAAAVVTLTERDREQYLRHLPCRRPIVAIPNPMTIKNDKRSLLQDKVVLAAGRLVPQKGFDLLLEAWARSQPLAHGWRLRIIGSGPDEQMLKLRARHLHVDAWVDFVPHTEDLAAHYASASIYALSSRFEGFALVLVEAKSFGLPIVSFDCACGPSEIVRDGTDGLLVADGDVAGLAQALLVLIGDCKQRIGYGQAAWEDDRFELDQVVARWDALLR